MPGCTHLKWSYQLVQDFFICMRKTNFIIHFILEILHFKQSCNLIGWQHRELEFCLIWDWWWNIKNKISFHFRLYTRKSNDKSFQKKSKKNLFWGHFGPFLPKFGQKWIFLEKRSLSVFRNSNYLLLCQKLEKTIGQFLRKTPNWWTDRQMMVIFGDICLVHIQNCSKPNLSLPLICKYMHLRTPSHMHINENFWWKAKALVVGGLGGGGVVDDYKHVKIYHATISGSFNWI